MDISVIDSKKIWIFFRTSLHFLRTVFLFMSKRNIFYQKRERIKEEQKVQPKKTTI